MAKPGAVAIGRNEGERFKRCLRSLLQHASPVVYVDSGSTDGSVDYAREHGANVIELDTSIPFTAARARNAGFERLREVAPDVSLVMFVDGDCEVAADWWAEAVAFLSANDGYAVVCGRRRERHPGASVYNYLCDVEWNTPVGDARACGGDALMRVDALAAAKGFNAGLIAGEEPELCVRLRAAGWCVRRIDADMTFHDAAMTRFTQWWKRATRAGHAYAEGAHLHGAPPERHWVGESRRIVAWGLALPALLVVAAPFTGGWSLAGLALYPLNVMRLALKRRRQTPRPWVEALFLVAGKFPESIGWLRFQINRLAGRRTSLIEYKRGAER